MGYLSPSFASGRLHTFSRDTGRRNGLIGLEIDSVRYIRKLCRRTTMGGESELFLGPFIEMIRLQFARR